MRHPNFFIIGAAKSGTSSLAKYAGAHPAVFMSPIKEPSYFLGPPPQISKPRIAVRFFQPIVNDRYRTNVNDYLQLFADAQTQPIVGEASPAYSQLPHHAGVAEKIYRFNPDARFVYLLRDPIERTISHYWYNAETEDELRDIHSAITEDSYYTDVSYYAMQLRSFLHFFPKEQFKIVTTESLASHPATVLRDLFSWLGVDSDYLPENIHQRFNPTPKVVTQLKTTGFLHHVRYSRPWGMIGRIVPSPIRTAARRLVERQIDRRTVDLSPVIDYLRPMQIRQTTELAELLGREFDEWTTLYGPDDNRMISTTEVAAPTATTYEMRD